VYVELDSLYIKRITIDDLVSYVYIVRVDILHLLTCNRKQKLFNFLGECRNVYFSMLPIDV
jgi:hypothetical protein